MNALPPEAAPSVILGGGPSGLGIADRLLSAGQKALVLEKQPHCGGLSQTIHHQGCKVDFGPHIFHTNKQDIIDFVAGLLRDDLVSCKIKVRVYLNGHFVPYPIKGIRALTVLHWRTALHAVVDLLWARLNNMIRPTTGEASFEEWIVKHFGRTIYRIYFGLYAEKVWKLSPKEISSYVAVRRVPVFSITDYIRKLFSMKPKLFHHEDQDFVRVFYPRHGIGQVMDRMVDGITQKGGVIQTESEVEEVVLDGSKVSHIVYRNGRERRRVKTDFVFSTMPLTLFIQRLRPAPPEDVVHAAAALRYNLGRFLYIVVKKEKVFDAALTYFQDPLIPFNRVYSLRHLSVECVPPHREVLCVEFTCAPGDALLSTSEEELFQNAMKIFEDIHVLEREDVAHFFSRTVDFAYPVFRVDYEKHLDVIFRYLESIQNLIVLGRQGLFCYANIDEVLTMGFRSADRYLSGKVHGVNYEELFGEFMHRV